MREIEPFPQHWLSRYTEDELERLAIMTVDGGVSDKMAEKYIERRRNDQGGT